MAAKLPFKFVDYYAAKLSSSIKSSTKYCEAMKAMLNANGWTEDEYINHLEKEPMNGPNN